MSWKERINIGGKAYTAFDKVLTRGRKLRVKFRVKDRYFSCFVPDDSLQTAVKDVLLLNEYGMIPQFSVDELNYGTIVDGGAHVGLFSLKSSPYAKCVIAIEPVRENYLLLTENLRRNRVSNVVPVNKALWSRNSKLRLNHAQTSYGTRVGEDPDGSVIAISLEEIVKKCGKVDLLKLDVEGAENKILLESPAEVFQKISMIVGELHSSRKQQKMIESRLKNLGYTVVLLDPPIFNPHFSLRFLAGNSLKVSGLWVFKSIVFLQYAVFGILKGAISPEFRDNVFLFASYHYRNYE